MVKTKITEQGGILMCFLKLSRNKRMKGTRIPGWSHTERLTLDLKDEGNNPAGVRHGRQGPWERTARCALDVTQHVAGDMGQCPQSSHEKERPRVYAQLVTRA